MYRIEDKICGLYRVLEKGLIPSLALLLVSNRGAMTAAFRWLRPGRDFDRGVGIEGNEDVCCGDTGTKG